MPRLMIVVALLALAVEPQRSPPGDWQSLFDGRTLGQWRSTQFGGEGEVTVDGGHLVLGFGDPLTGVTWSGPLPRMDYELEVEAMKLAGNDFFCGLTFPVGDSSCSLILGGWGGATVGLSSLDRLDASENETSQHIAFEQGRWYAARVRVTNAAIEVWLDGRPIITARTTGRKIGVRPEVELSRPLGIAAYRTRAAIRAVRLRPL